MKKFNNTLYTITQSLDKLTSIVQEEDYQSMSHDQKTVLLNKMKYVLDTGNLLMEILITDNDEKS